MSALGASLLAVATLGFALLTVNVHEHGHRLVGRALGVPRGDIRVDLRARPPHVALRAGRGWLSPDDEGYADAFARHRPGGAAAWSFIAGGLAIETVVASAGALVLVAGDAAEAARVWAWCTAGVNALYLAVDAATSVRSVHPGGDFSAMWQLRSGTTGALVVAVIAVKGLVIVATY